MTELRPEPELGSRGPRSGSGSTAGCCSGPPGPRGGALPARADRSCFVAGQRLRGTGRGSTSGSLIPIALGLRRYLTTSFRIARRRVELRRGLLNRHVLSTPLDRVRTVDLTASPIHRILGLTTVRIGTGTASTGLGRDASTSTASRPTGPVSCAPSCCMWRRLDAGRRRGRRRRCCGARRRHGLVLRFDPGWARFAPFTSSGVVITAGLFGGAGSQLLNELGAFDSRRHRTTGRSTCPVWIARGAGRGRRSWSAWPCSP